MKEHMALHVEELTEDMNVYGWDKVRVFHAAWLNQIEQNRCEWPDDEQKQKMRRSLVWHVAMTSKASSTSFSVGSGTQSASNIRAWHQGM